MRKEAYSVQDFTKETTMKDKNKNSAAASEPDVVHPIACLYCQHTEFEKVQIHGAYGGFINRLAEMTFLGYLISKSYQMYGYRCLYCGYLMWFTARNLD